MTTDLLLNSDARPEHSLVTERSRRFYLFAIWIPIIVPVLCGLSFAIRGGGSYAGVGDSIGMILMMSLLIGGVPYLVVVFWLNRWLRNPTRTERQVRLVMWTAPLIVAAIAMPMWMASGLGKGFEENFIGSVVFFFLPYLLAIGYLYVIATAIAHWAYMRRARDL
jgi:hypothetical protein